MVQIISSRLAFTGKNSPVKSPEPSKRQDPAQVMKDAGFTEEDIVSLRDTVDQFRRALRLPDEAGTAAASRNLGEAFTDDVYVKVNQAMRQVRNHKLKGSLNRAGALKDLLSNDEMISRRFEIGKFTLQTVDHKPSLVMLMPKPVQNRQFADLTSGLSLRWLDTDIPPGCWLIDADNLKRIYCTSDASDLAALRKRHAANTTQGNRELKQAMTDYFTLSGQ